MGIDTKLTRALRSPRRIPRGLRWRFRLLRIRVNNTVAGLKSKEATGSSGSRLLDEIKQKALVPTDISDHLVTIFVEALSMSPRLAVELGVRDGESHFVMERVTEVAGARLVSVDIDDCSSIAAQEHAVFVQSDDVEFAGRFESWCAEAGVAPEIDVLFVDTSHLYEHTVAEIAAWFPHLAQRSKVLFHDTNLKDVYRRRDGSLGTAWDNDRGVIRAIEEYFGTSFDEEQDFIDFRNGWLIKHHAACNGLTILERVSPG